MSLVTFGTDAVSGVWPGVGIDVVVSPTPLGYDVVLFLSFGDEVTFLPFGSDVFPFLMLYMVLPPCFICPFVLTAGHALVVWLFGVDACPSVELGK